MIGRIQQGFSAAPDHGGVGVRCKKIKKLENGR